MSGNMVPRIDPSTGQWTGIVAGPGSAPTGNLADYLPQMQRERPSALAAGLNVGWQNFVGSGGSALEALGRATDWGGLERYGRSVADSRAAQAAAAGRPDLDTAPWREGGASPLSWLGYQAAQQVPNLATMVVATLAAGPAGTAASAARIGGMGAAYAALGGRAGLAAGAAMLPQAAGSMYREGVESARATTGDQAARPEWGTAAAALGLSPVYAAMEAVPFARLAGVARGVGAGAAGASRLGRAGRGALEVGATEFGTEAVQSGMEQMFRPDLPIGERANNVLDGALTGFAVGGLFGGAGGLVSRGATRPVRDVPADAVTDDALTTAVDQALTPTPMSRPAAATATQGDLFGEMLPVPVQRGGQIEPEREIAPADKRNIDLGLPELPGADDSASLVMPATPQTTLEQALDPAAQSGERPTWGLDVAQTVRQGLADAGAETRDNQQFRQFVRRFQAQDELGLALEVREQLDNPRAPKRLNDLAVGMGFFDAEGRTRDFAAELAAAREVGRQALATGDRQAAAGSLQQIERIQRAQRIQDALAQHDAGQVPTTQAPPTPDQGDLFAPVPAAIGTSARPSIRREVADALEAQQLADIQAAQGDMFPAAPAAPRTSLREELAAALAPVAEEAQPAPMPVAPAAAPRTPATPAAPGATGAERMAQMQAPRTAAANLDPAANIWPQRMQAVATIAGVREQDARAAATWMQKFEAEGMSDDMAQQAERLVARVLRSIGVRTQGAARTNVGQAPVTAPTAETPVARGARRQGTAPPSGQVEAAAQPAVVTPEAPAPQTQPAAAVANPDAKPPSTAPAMVQGPQAALTQAERRDARRRMIADRRATEMAAPVPDVDAAQTDVRGEPQAAAGQRIRLNPRQVKVLEAIARDPLSGPDMVSAALEAINNPTRGRVDSVVNAFVGARRERDTARTRSEAARAAQPESRLRAILADKDTNPAMRVRVEAALAMPTDSKAFATRARSILADYDRRKTETQFMASSRDGSTPLPAATFDRAMDRILAKMAPAARDRVQVVNTAADLPAETLESADRQGFARSDIRAAHQSGTVYIVRDATTSIADMQEAVFHEIFGHVGARNLWGDGAHAALNDIFDRAGGVAGVRNLARRFGVESALEAYMPERMTPAAVARLVDELLAQAAGRATNKSALMARAWVARLKQGVVAFLDALGFRAAAERFRGYSASDMAATLLDMREAAGAPTQARPDDAAFLRVAEPIKAAEKAGKSAMDAVSGALDKVRDAAGKGKTINAAGRAQVLYVSTLNHIARTFGHLFPVDDKFTGTVDGSKNLVENLSNINRRRAAVSAKFADAFAPTWAAYERMNTEAPGLAKQLRWLMEVPAYEIDPRKSWADQAHLHDKPNKDRLREIVSEANKTYNQINKRGFGKVYDDMATYNQMQRYASMTTLLHTIVASEPRYAESAPVFGTDPMTEFMDEPALTTTDVDGMLNYWKGQFNARIAAADKVWREQLAKARGVDEATIHKIARVEPTAPPHLNDLAKVVRDLKASAAGLDKHPYFHLGRTGDYFASFTMKLDPARSTSKRPVPDNGAADRISAALKGAGFDDFTISTVSERPHTFMRVRTPDELAGLMKVINGLVASGDIQADTVSQGHRAEPAEAVAADAKFLQEAITRLQASPVFDPGPGATAAEIKTAEDAKAAAISQLRETWHNMLPAMSEARVMTNRKVVPGWSEDMMQSYAFRANVGNLALANMSTAHPMQATLGAMRGQLREAEQNPKNVSTDDTIRMWQVLNEVITRENSRETSSKRDMMDSFRAVNYAFFLGMSPAYALNNLTQPYTTLWPELAKQHGFVKSAKAVAKAMGTAMKIVGLAVREGWQSSLRQATEPAIAQSVLKRAGLDTATQEYLLRVVNTGAADIGSSARELSRLAESNPNKKLDNVLRVAGAIGLYSEIATRLTAAIALRDLNNGKKSDTDLVSDAVRMIDDTMFNYSESNVGRALGRSGIAGKYTPVAAAFQQFNAQMLEKLYREIASIAGQKRAGETDAQREVRRKEAVRFLGAHAAAITVLAGSLGLPFVTAIAAAINGLKDLFDDDDQPYDVQAQWRNFLGSTFGTDIGEVLARGAPRALGADLSGRVGEQNILPLSQFMADRRKWEDAAPDQAMRALGAPWSMVGNVAAGMREMMDGNILAGMQRAMPTALRGPITAGRMATQGYVDDRGGRLPVDDPGTAAIISQALGYTPAVRAEYQEANRTQQQFRGVVTREAANIRNRLAAAIETGDRDGARAALAEARQFDENNPAYAILPRIGSALQQRAVARARADALDVPLGVSLRDVAARDRTAFANY